MSKLVPVETVINEVRAFRPKWEGLYSFDKVWEGTVVDAVEQPLKETGDETLISARAGVNQVATKALRDCHPINFGKAQLAAIAGIRANDGVDPWEFLEDFRSPFPTLYLDFSDAARKPTQIKLGQRLVEDSALSLYGVLIETNETGRVDQITPFGTSVFLNGVEQSQVTAEGPEGYEQANPASAGAKIKLNAPHTQSELAIFDNPIPHIHDVGFAFTFSDLRQTVRESDGVWPLIRNAPSTAAITCGSQVLVNRALDNLPAREAALPVPFGDLDEQDQQFAIKEAWTAILQLEVVFDALYFLDAHNVTLGDATVSRQVRRKAEREGARIAQTVRVAATQVRRNRQPGKGGTANYSHRFERKGYTRHVTKGSHAKADLMKPCYRRDAKTNELTCPSGCRREWVPPTIVGDENLPFVPKARIVPGPNAHN